MMMKKRWFRLAMSLIWVCSGFLGGAAWGRDEGPWGRRTRPQENAPPEQQMGLPSVRVTADTFDKSVTRTKPRFKGPFTVGIVFVNFPDCETIDVEACLKRQSEGAETYYKRYTLNQCWPVFKVLGVYRAPNPLGYYVKYDTRNNLIGSSSAEEVSARVGELWRDAFRSVNPQGSWGKPKETVDVRVLAYATKRLPVTRETPAQTRTLDRLPALRKQYPKITLRQSEAELSAIGWQEHRNGERDLLEDYRPARAIAWGDPLWPNSRVIVQAEGSASTMIHELGHVLGAPDTYHAPERNDGLPGNPVIAGGGPTAPLYCRYRYCGLLGPDAYPIIRKDTTLRLAPRWGTFDGSAPLGIFIPTEHPNYLLHLEYEPSADHAFDATRDKEGIGKISGEHSPLGGIYLYYINVTQGDPYHGPPDLVYSYRKRDPHFRGVTEPSPGAAGNDVGPRRRRTQENPLAIFREGDSFDATSDPANLLPNLLPTGVTLTFGPQTAEGAEVTIGVPTRRLQGQELRRSLLPVLRLEPITELLPTSFRASLTVRFRGEPTFADFGFCYGPAPNPTVRNALCPLWGFSDWRDTARITGLRPGSTLYVRAYARNALGVAYSPECHKVTLPSSVEEVPPLLLDHYHVPLMSGHYDRDGYIYNHTGAAAFLKLMALFRRPLDGSRPSAKDGFSYDRLHPAPGGPLPPRPERRYGPTLTDLTAAYAKAIELAEAAALFSGPFPEDFDQRIAKTLRLRQTSTMLPPALAQAARNAGLTPAQAKALMAPVVPLEPLSLPLLLPRIQASLRASLPVLCVRASTFESNRRYGLYTCLIDGWRPNPDDPANPILLHLNFPTGYDRNPSTNRPTGWYAPDVLFDHTDAGKLIFLNPPTRR